MILAQACILIDADMTRIVQPVQLCNRLSQRDVEIKADVHTPLFSHLQKRPSIESLMQTLADCFLRYA